MHIVDIVMIIVSLNGWLSNASVFMNVPSSTKASAPPLDVCPRSTEEINYCRELFIRNWAEWSHNEFW